MPNNEAFRRRNSRRAGFVRIAARDLDQRGVPRPALPRTHTAITPDPEVAALIREATALARRKA